MYASVSSFLQNMSADSPVLWAGFVIAVVAGVSLTMYQFWETVLKAVSKAERRKSRDSTR